MAGPMDPTFARYQLKAYQRLAAKMADFRLCNLNNEMLQDRLVGQMRLLVQEFYSLSLFLDYNTRMAFETNVSRPIRRELGQSNMGDNTSRDACLEVYWEVCVALTEIILPTAEEFLNQKYNYPFLA